MIRLLAIGDVHLGRRPSRLPEPLTTSTGARVPGPAMAWQRAIEHASEQAVDAVLLAGDVVEQADDFHEAFVDLRAGVERLAGRGIAVIGVSGNHDGEVLPRLAAEIPDFRLLGQGGVWETAEVVAASGQRVRIVGWSFPAPRVEFSPLAQALPARTDATTTIGLLHCDRDQPGSGHAPVRSHELRGAPVDAWLLGHIHQPDDLDRERPIGYLGSLTGLDPGEAGARGPWLVTVAGDGTLGVEHRPLAPLRWESLPISVDDLQAAEDVHGRITRALDALHADLTSQPYRPVAVGCRLLLTGRTHLRRALEQTLTEADLTATLYPQDGIDYFIHDWRLQVQPTIDLEATARGHDPVALLARRLLVLRGGDSAQRRRLIAAARERMTGVIERRPYADLAAPPPDDEAVAAHLEAAALRLLEELDAQRRSGP